MIELSMARFQSTMRICHRNSSVLGSFDGMPESIRKEAFPTGLQGSNCCIVSPSASCSNSISKRKHDFRWKVQHELSPIRLQPSQVDPHHEFPAFRHDSKDLHQAFPRGGGNLRSTCCGNGHSRQASTPWQGTGKATILKGP